MSVYCFIFARGGSKGLVRKNVKLLAGKPLIQYSIEIALATPEIEKVFVSTEDDEIAQVAISAGALVIDRPEELAGDASSEWMAWQHAIEWVNNQYEKFDVFVSLPATSPLRSVADVQAAISKLKLIDSDICISVTEASRSPYFNMVQNLGEYVELVNPPCEVVERRQDAPPVFDITTVVYATYPEFVLENDGIFSGRVTSVIVPKERAVDIDDIYDFMLAETIVVGREKDE
jgi:CMP-N-acetylneuraminic acid synthetase